jgi:hypothetical protein
VKRMTSFAGSTNLPHQKDSRVDEAVRQFISVGQIEAQLLMAEKRLSRLVTELTVEECSEYVRRTS